MIIELKKFGDMLTSREAGGEALAAFLPTLRALKNDEKIKIDFRGVSVLTPSWADEFIGKLWIEYGEKILFVNDENPSVQSALQFARPNLDLSEIMVFNDKLVFSEKNGNKIYNTPGVINILTFPYDEEDALRILKNNKAKRVRVRKADAVSETRLKDVVNILNREGIKTTT